MTKSSQETSTKVFDTSQDRPQRTRRELAHRESAGVDVSLLWNKINDGLVVVVHSRVNGEYVELPIASEDPAARGRLALEVFNHPTPYLYNSGRLDEGHDLFTRQESIEAEAA